MSDADSEDVSCSLVTLYALLVPSGTEQPDFVEGYYLQPEDAAFAHPSGKVRSVRAIKVGHGLYRLLGDTVKLTVPCEPAKLREAVRARAEAKLTPAEKYALGLGTSGDLLER